MQQSCHGRIKMQEQRNQNPGELSLKEFYEESIEERLDYIRFINSENKVFQEIRENHPQDWEIVELCRELIFNNIRAVNYYLRGIENDRSKETY